MLSHTKMYFISNIYWHYCLPQFPGHVALWIRHLTTNQGLPGSSHGKLWIFCPILRYILYQIFTGIIVDVNSVAFWPNHQTSDYESGNSRFVSWQGRNILSHTKVHFIPNIYWHYCWLQHRGLVVQLVWHMSRNQGIPGSSLSKIEFFCLIIK